MTAATAMYDGRDRRYHRLRIRPLRRGIQPEQGDRKEHSRGNDDFGRTGDTPFSAATRDRALTDADNMHRQAVFGELGILREIRLTGDRGTSAELYYEDAQDAEKAMRLYE